MYTYMFDQMVIDGLHLTRTHKKLWINVTNQIEEAKRKPPKIEIVRIEMEG